MEQQGLTRRDLEEILKRSSARAPDRRSLEPKVWMSIAMIRRLHERLGISADVLIRLNRKRAA